MEILRKHRGKILWLIGLAALLAVVAALFWPRTAAITTSVTSSPPKQPAQTSTGDSTRKNPAQKASYAVPASHPRQLTIPKIAVDANVLPVGTLADGSLDAPKTAWDVGWYDKSSLPGLATNGALVIDGHVNDIHNQPGVFFALDTLARGDKLQIQRGDGKLLTYIVVKIEQKPTAQVDMAAVMRPITPGKEAVNLITCGGTYDKAAKTYSDRVIVFTERTG